jgi:hypothetical protein
MNSRTAAPAGGVKKCYRLALIAMLVGGIGGGALGRESKQGQPPSKGAAKIEPKANDALRRMSDYLSGLKTFRVETTTVDETNVSKNGQKIQQLAESKIAVRRPGELRIDRISSNGHVVFRDDGKQFSVYNSDQNTYATAPAPGDLQRAADQLREHLQGEAPGLDLIGTESYANLTDGVTEGRYVGLVPMGGGVMAHHLAVIKKGVTYQIWIQDGPQPLPLRYVVTGRDMPGSPQFTIELRNWQPNAPVPNSTFAFTPPSGAKKVAFAPSHKG